MQKRRGAGVRRKVSGVGESGTAVRGSEPNHTCTHMSVHSLESLDDIVSSPDESVYDSDDELRRAE